MATARFRVYPAIEEACVESTEDPRIPIRLADLYPLLSQAYEDNYVWLHDLEGDRILVSPDLFEVVRAFAECRPTS